MTGWTFEQYDEAPAPRLARMMLYVGMKNSIEAEKAESASRSRGRMTGAQR